MIICLMFQLSEKPYETYSNEPSSSDRAASSFLTEKILEVKRKMNVLVDELSAVDSQVSDLDKEIAELNATASSE